jgi:hypothetical protein
MKDKLLYVELKSGHGDSGPAWIGKARVSKSGRTLYFNGLALKSADGEGIQGNYFDSLTGEEYWVSGAKKNQQDRHWAGSGIVMVDETVVGEYLAFTGLQALDPRRFKIVRLDHSVVAARNHLRENARQDEA